MPSSIRIPLIALLLLTACATPRAAPAPAGTSAEAAEAAEGQVYAVNQVQVPPRLLNAGEFTRTLARTFPPALHYPGSRGRVTVSFIVGSNGTPRAVTILRASHDAFVQPTRDAVQRMRFSPGMRGGRAVAVRIEQPIDWAVGGAPLPPR